MPPRKSNVSQISTDPDGGGTPVKERDGINIEDLSLPRTMVQRLAKGVLPPNTILQKDAIAAISKGATVFINYLAQQASDTTSNINKRTIPPTAVLEALGDLEFENFVPRVDAELAKHIELQTGKRNEYRQKVKDQSLGQKGGAGRGAGEGDTMGSGVGDGEEEEEGRAAKRVRRDGEDGGVEVNGAGSGDGHEQLLMEEDTYGEGEVEEGDEGEEDRGRREEEGDEEEDEEEEEEGEGDEYPDEGRRLSSVEREDHEGPYPRSPGYDDGGTGESSGGGEEGLSDVSD